MASLWLFNAVLFLTLLSGFNCLTIQQIETIIKGPLAPERSLKLSGRGLGGPIPTTLGLYTNLTVIDLSNNNLTGPIPLGLSKLRRLQTLNLAENNLTGGIPEEFGNYKNLENLYLSGNSLSGPLPSTIGSATKLVNLELFGNQLSGPIPPEIGNLSFLMNLHLADNQLSGSIPTELGDIGGEYSFLPPSGLNLSFNRLSGPIPANLGRLSGLHFLDLSSNRLSGAFPFSFAKFLKLEFLNLADNELSGPCPTFAKLPLLGAIIMRNNSFSGPIASSIGQCPSLLVLDLGGNSFSGPIPPALGSFKVLQGLLLGDNNLTGPIPPELAGLTRLTFLVIAGNNIGGPMPAELAKLSKLTFLDLSRNPASLGILPSDFSRLQNLTQLSLPGPNIPTWLKSSQSLRALKIDGMQGACPLQSHGLDLSPLPKNCKYVSLRNRCPQLNTLRLWSGCDTGCALNLIGTSARLGRDTREDICLGRVSAFLEGDSPDFVPGNDGDIFLLNRWGNLSLFDPDFVDRVDLGPGGKAYTGVSFTKVQRGNLCGNSEAPKVIATLYSLFAVGALLGVMGTWLVARHLRAQVSDFKPQSSAGGENTVTFGKWLWGIFGLGLTYSDLALDILVLKRLYGAWPFWVGLFSILASVTAAAITATVIFLQKGIPSGRVSFTWHALLSRQLSMKERPLPPRLSALQRLAVLVVWPLAVPLVVLLDILGILDRFGLHPQIRETVFLLEPWLDARAFLDTLLRTVPQVVLQTVVYWLGSSRSTRNYIDGYLFVKSNGLALGSMLSQILNASWEAFSSPNPEYPWGPVVRRLSNVQRSWEVDNDEAGDGACQELGVSKYGYSDKSGDLY